MDTDWSVFPPVSTHTLHWDASDGGNAITYSIYGIGPADVPGGSPVETLLSDSVAGNGNGHNQWLVPNNETYTEYRITVNCPDGSAGDSITVAF